MSNTATWPERSVYSASNSESFDGTHKPLNDLDHEYLRSKFAKRNEIGYSLRDPANKMVVSLKRKGKLNHFINLTNYLIATLGKLET